MTSELPSGTERFLRGFGRYFITPVFALGNSIITTMALSGLSFIAAIGFPWILPILGGVFLAEILIATYLYKDSVPETLVDLFAKNIFKELSWPKRILLGLGGFCALSGGVAIGALTYTSSIALPATVIKIISSFIILGSPPAALVIGIAAFIAIVGFFAISSLLFKWIKKAIQNDIHLQIKNFFFNLFKREPNKPLLQQILERIFKVLFIGAIVAITIVGTIATLGTLYKGLFGLLTLIPNANTLACTISSAIIVYGFLAVARLPWALTAVCTVFADLGQRLGKEIYKLCCPSVDDLKSEVGPENESSSGLSTAAKMVATLVHGFSFAALAESGGGAVLTDILTTIHTPLPAETLVELGQVSSLAAGGVMAGGIGAFTLFYQSSAAKPIADKNDILSSNESFYSDDEIPATPTESSTIA